jgi:PAS domain-containing protein
LNVKAPAKHRLDRDQARRAGLDGRKDGAEFACTPQLVTAQDIALIRALCERLEWTEDRLRGFLESTRSPLAKRADKAIRTTRDANKVIWALKRIARRSGVWKERAA